MSASHGYTTYPENRDLLKRELEKLLKDDERQSNIAKVRKLIEAHLPDDSAGKGARRGKRGK